MPFRGVGGVTSPAPQREVILPDGRHVSERYRMPDGSPLQVWPQLTQAEFKSEDDFWAYLDEIIRFNNFLTPSHLQQDRQDDPSVPAPNLPSPRQGPQSVSHQVGLRLSPADYGLLKRLSAAHSVKPATMARILVSRGVRAAFDD